MGQHSEDRPCHEHTANGDAHTGARRVALRGAIDLARRDEVAACFEPLWRGDADVVIDLSEVSFMDSSGLSALATLARDLEPHGRRVVCIGARRPVARLIRLAGIDTVVDLR